MKPIVFVTKLGKVLQKKLLENQDRRMAFSLAAIDDLESFLEVAAIDDCDVFVKDKQLRKELKALNENFKFIDKEPKNAFVIFAEVVDGHYCFSEVIFN